MGGNFKALVTGNLVALNQRHHHDVHRSDALGASTLSSMLKKGDGLVASRKMTKRRV